MISFTRTAIKELRDRIEAFAKKPISVAGLQILTLDSFTWQVLRGLSDDESADLMGDYETNIKQFVQQLKGGDAQLLEYLEEFEHVILDEGQDLVGERAELAIPAFGSHVFTSRNYADTEPLPIKHRYAPASVWGMF